MFRKTICLISILCLILSIGNGYAAPVEYNIVAIKGIPHQRAFAAILEQAFRKMGAELKVDYLPGKRALAKSMSGKVIGEVARIEAFQKGRDQLIRIPVSVGKFRAVAFSLKENEKFMNWDQFKPYQIGALRGIVWVESQTETGFKKIYANDFENLIQLLKYGRIDYGFEAYRSVDFYSRKLGVSVQYLTPDIFQFDMYPFIHENFRFLVEPLTRTLRKMEQSGELEKIREQAFEEIFERF